MSDTICLWVGRFVVFGGCVYALAVVGYAAFVGLAVGFSFRRKP